MFADRAGFDRAMNSRDLTAGAVARLCGGAAYSFSIHHRVEVDSDEDTFPVGIENVDCGRK
jgi:hypothetical protein